MAWPLFPIVVYKKVQLTAGLALALALSMGVAWTPAGAFMGLFAAPFLVALALRFFRGASSTTRDLFCSTDGFLAKKARVSKVAQEIVRSGGRIRMFKKTASNTFRPDQIKKRSNSEGRVDLSDFCHVIEPRDRSWRAGGLEFVDVEASTTFERFVAALLPMGYMPLCVPELRSITVGGAVVGIGIESSCFKYGFFHEGMMEADILLGSGEVVTVSPDRNPDLFRAIPNSLGCFGYLLRLRMRVQPIKPFVRIEKRWFPSPEAFVEELKRASALEAGNDFVDGVALSTTGGMVITGTFSDSPRSGVSRYDWDTRPFYETLCHEGVELMTVENYIWRYDVDWFWCSQIFPLLNFPWVRWLCGKDLLRSDQYKLFNDQVISWIPKCLNKNEELVIQDIEVPVERSAEWIHEHCRIVRSDLWGKIKLSRANSTQTTVPIWCCPVRMREKATLLPMAKGELYINFGFWDSLTDKIATKGGDEAGLLNRALEDSCEKYGAVKTLYSTSYYGEKEFMSLYDPAGEYPRLKKKYDPKDALRGWFQRLKGH